MDDYDLEKTHALESLGRYIDAGKARAVAGDIIEAINLFIQGGDHDLAAQYLCDALWEQLPYGTLLTNLNRERVSALQMMLPKISTSNPQLKNEVRILLTPRIYAADHD